jgi:hypothetical protein
MEYLTFIVQLFEIRMVDEVPHRSSTVYGLKLSKNWITSRNLRLSIPYDGRPIIGHSESALWDRNGHRRNIFKSTLFDIR